jgi:hypothetical protein
MQVLVQETTRLSLLCFQIRFLLHFRDHHPKKKNLQKYGRLQPPSRQALTARSKVRTSAFVPLLLFSLLQSHVVADHDGASSGPSTA